MTPTPAIRVPAPAACPWCGGARCDACGQTGTGACAFVLDRSRTFAVRAVEYQPVCGGVRGRLTVWCRRTPNAAPRVGRYRVEEFPCDFRGRAFALVKVGTDRSHEAFLGADGSATCSCEGESYQSAAKANQRAHDAGAETFVTLGCVHLDALAALCAAGWLVPRALAGRGVPRNGAQQEDPKRQEELEVAARPDPGRNAP